MPIIIALIGVIGAVYFFVHRARNAANMTGELLDVANDVRLAARRFGFSRRTNLHPVEAIEDPEIAIAAIGWAFVELDQLPSAEQQLMLKKALHKHRNLSLEAAEEMMILGRWLVSESGGAFPAVSRLTRKLIRLQPRDESFFTPLMSVLSEVTNKGGSSKISDRQSDALDDIRRAYRIT
ncbi:MAG: hypothetical protein ACRBBV_14605 [Paracoccaceae bacterium]